MTQEEHTHEYDPRESLAGHVDTIVTPELTEHYTSFPQYARLSRMANCLAVGEYAAVIQVRMYHSGGMMMAGMQDLLDSAHAVASRAGGLVAYGYANPEGLEAMYFKFKVKMEKYIAFPWDDIESTTYPTPRMLREQEKKDKEAGA